jgi:hypothetical protein
VSDNNGHAARSEALIQDAREFAALCANAPVQDLHAMRAAYAADLIGASAPETIAFCAGRIALIGFEIHRRPAARAPKVEAALLKAVLEEMTTREQPIELVLRPITAFSLAGALQLALRHPALAEPSAGSAEAARLFIEHVRAYFADTGAEACLEVLRRGDDPAEDR